MKQAYTAVNQSNNELISVAKSDQCYSGTLTANTAQSFAIPQGARFVAFQFAADIWACEDNPSIAVPSGFTQSNIEFNPDSWAITEGAATVDVISPIACAGSVIFYG